MSSRRASLALLAGELDEKAAEKAFTRWVNYALRDTDREVTDLGKDFCDGVTFCTLLEVLTDKKINFHRTPSNKATRTENVHLALEFLEFRLNFKSYGLNVQDIETGNKKVIFGLIFQLANRFQVNRSLGLVEGSSEASAKQKLLRWCKECTAAYPDVNINNFDSSFQDGLALCSILSNFMPTKISMKSLSKESAVFNLNLAMNIAAVEGGVPRLLDAEDFLRVKKTDDSLVMIYVSFYYKWLTGANAPIPPPPAAAAAAAAAAPPVSAPVPVAANTTASNNKNTEASPPVPLDTPAQKALWQELTSLRSKLTQQEIIRLLEGVGRAQPVQVVPIPTRVPPVATKPVNSVNSANSVNSQDLERAREEANGLRKGLLAEQQKNAELRKEISVLKSPTDKANGDALEIAQLMSRVAELEAEIIDLKRRVDRSRSTSPNPQNLLAPAVAPRPDRSNSNTNTSISQIVAVGSSDYGKRQSVRNTAEAVASEVLQAFASENEFKPFRASVTEAAKAKQSLVPQLPAPSRDSIASQDKDYATFIVSDPVASSDEDDSDTEAVPLERRQTREDVRRQRVERVVSALITEEADLTPSSSSDSLTNLGKGSLKMRSAPFRSGADAIASNASSARATVPFPVSPAAATPPNVPAAEAADPSDRPRKPLGRHFSVLRDQAPTVLRRVSTLPDVVKPAVGFRLEDGTNYPWWLNTSSAAKLANKDALELDPLLHQPLLENPEYDTSWYAKYFFGREHHLLIGEHSELGSFVVTTLREDVNDIPTGILCLSSAFTQIRVMVWLKTGIERATIPLTVDRASLSIAEVLAEVAPWMLKGLVDLRTSSDPKLPERLVQIEEIQTSRNFKFGILYVKEGQSKEEEMFSNEGSAEFDEFLSLIGQKVALDGWDKFRGGLDAKNGKTGSHSVYTEYSGYDIMFHVSTLLPYSANDPQQLERKRHIGNDICSIIFMDTNDPLKFKPSFAPDAISSHFLHVFVIVRPGLDESGKRNYTVNVCSRDDVPFFGPVMRNPPVFDASPDLRDFVLTKLINGETATYLAPSFTTKMARTLAGTLNNFASDSKEASKVVKKGALLSSIKPISAGSSAKGELTGMQRIMAGNSALKVLQATTVLAELSLEVQGADRWSDDYLVAATQGLYFFDGAGMTEIKMLKRRKFLQVNVIASLSIVITVCVRMPGGHPYVVVFDLESIAGHRKHNFKVREAKLDDTRNVNLFAIDPTWDGQRPFYLVCTVKQKLWVYVWQTSSRLFKKVKMFGIPDLCTVVGLRGSLAIIGSTSDFIVINVEDARDGASSVDSTTVTAGAVTVDQVDPLDIVHLEKEILISYGNESMFVDLNGKQSRDYVIKWNSFPHSVVYVHPFVIGFMRDSVEVRTLVNGRLVQALPLQSSCPLCFTQRPQSRILYVANCAVDQSTSNNNNTQIHRLIIAAS